MLECDFRINIINRKKEHRSNRHYQHNILTNVIKLNPAHCNKLAISTLSTNGLICDEIPPNLSNSANCNDTRNSYNVSIAGITPNKHPSLRKHVNI